MVKSITHVPQNDPWEGFEAMGKWALKKQELTFQKDSAPAHKAKSNPRMVQGQFSGINILWWTHPTWLFNMVYIGGKG